MHIDILLNAFPTSLSDDVKQVIRILPIDNNVRSDNGETYYVENLICPDLHHFQLDGEQLCFPYRVYFNEPVETVEEKLTDLQKTILNSIYSRHHDGYVRQKRLELLNNKTEYFIVPFTLKLLGEYIIEILEVLDKQINPGTVSKYKKYLIENKNCLKQTECRVVSYWNAYYRHPGFENLKDYIGKKIIEKLKTAKSS